MKNLLLLALLAGFLIGCGDKSKIYQFQVTDLEPNLITLSSDEFMGRMPFTAGEELTTSFLESKFKEMGLEPGNGDSYFQEVPMVSIITYPEQSMEFKNAQGSVVGEGLKDFVIWTQRTDSLVRIQDAEVVFAGFGIVAPEYGWDDYKNLDVKGKIVVVLINDPGFGSEDSTFFKGNTMTYYGRWT
jgi:hypothetical protein